MAFHIYVNVENKETGEVGFNSGIPVYNLKFAIRVAEMLHDIGKKIMEWAWFE